MESRLGHKELKGAPLSSSVVSKINANITYFTAFQSHCNSNQQFSF